MTTTIVREWINGVWAVMSLCIVAIFILYLADESKTPGAYWRPRVQAAIALLFCFFGTAVYRGWAWLILKFQTEGLDYSWLEQAWWIGILGALISIFGSMCCVRVFARESWAHWTWIGIVLLSVLFVILVKVATLAMR